MWEIRTVRDPGATADAVDGKPPGYERTAIAKLGDRYGPRRGVSCMFDPAKRSAAGGRARTDTAPEAATRFGLGNGPVARLNGMSREGRSHSPHGLEGPRPSRFAASCLPPEAATRFDLGKAAGCPPEWYALSNALPVIQPGNRQRCPFRVFQRNQQVGRSVPAEPWAAGFGSAGTLRPTQDVQSRQARFNNTRVRSFPI